MPSTALADNLFQDRVLYSWNSAAMRYQGEGGRFVSHNTIRDAVRQVIEGVSQELGASTLAMMAGDMNLIEWEGQMASTIRTVHAIGAAVNAGGWGQLTPQDMAYVEDVITQQLDLLSQFAVQIETGAQALTAQVLQRANMYRDAGVTAQKEIGVEHAQAAGLDYYRNVLGPAEHCDGCLEASAAGWVAIGTLVPIGERDCRTNCKCTWEYGNADDVKPMDISPLTSTAVAPNVPFTGAPTAPSVPIANVDIAPPSAASDTGTGNVVASAPLRAPSQPTDKNTFYDITIPLTDAARVQMTADETQALRDYKGGDYESLNRNLRRDATSAEQQGMITNLDSALQRVTLPTDVQTYRLLNFRSDRPLPDDFENAKVGQVITEKGYMSTSLDTALTRIWPDEYYADQKLVNMSIHVPAGVNGLLTDRLVGGAQEEELLLPRDTKLLITDLTRKDDGSLDISAEVVSNVQTGVQAPIWDPKTNSWVPGNIADTATVAGGIVMNVPDLTEVQARTAESLQNVVDKSQVKIQSLEAKKTLYFDRLDQISAERANPDVSEERYQELGKQMENIWDSTDAVSAAIHDERNAVRGRVLDELRKGKSESDYTVITETSGVVSDAQKTHVEGAVAEAKAFIDAVTGKSPELDGETIRISIESGVTRAHYLRSAYVSDGIGTIAVGPDADASTIVHEWGHFLEDKYGASIQEPRRALYAARTANEPASRLDDLFPGDGYSRDEVTRKDAFIHPYAGKVYGDPLDESSEMISMGVQMLYDDPAKLMREDPAMFRLVMRLVRE